MQLEKIKQEINQLGLSEKLLLIEDVWDSIAQTNKELPMPEWQKKSLILGISYTKPIDKIFMTGNQFIKISETNTNEIEIY